MITAKDIMTRDVITVSPDTEMTKAARILIEKHINGLPVVDENGELKGIICQSDLILQQKKLPIPSFFTVLDGLISMRSMNNLQKEAEKIFAVTVAQAMSPNPLTVVPDTGIQEIAGLMADMNFHTIPVVQEGILVGVIGKEDVLRTLLPGD